MSSRTPNWKVYLVIGFWSAVNFIVITWLSQFISGSVTP